MNKSRGDTTLPSSDYQSNAQAKQVAGSVGDVFTSFPVGLM